MSHPLDLLPTEMWKAVSSHLPPSDLLSFSQATQLFFDLTKPERVQFLLPVVVPLLADLNSIQKYTDFNRMSLLRTDMLNLRLVCKNLDKAVQDYYQRHIYETSTFIDERNLTRSHFQLPIFSKDSPRQKLQLLLNRLAGREVIGRKLSLFRLTHSPKSNANPILSRDLSLWDSSFQVGAAATVIRQLFQDYGHHLQRLSISLSDSDDAGRLPEQYLHLRRRLLHTPNLEYLKIELRPSFMDFRVIPRGEIAELKDFIEARPLPNLPHLSTLLLNDLPSSMQNALLQKYGQVERLELQPNSQEFEVYAPVHLPNLKYLQVSVGANLELLVMKRLITPSWLQLQTLTVYILDPYRNNDSGELVAPTFGQVVTFINDSFSGSTQLRRLFLAFPTPYYQDQSFSPDQFLQETQKCRLQLPHVEEVKFRACNDCSLDFLLPMAPFLRKAAVQIGYDNNFLPNVTARIMQIVQWDGWLGKSFLRSNVWTLFPQLRFVRVERFQKKWLTYRRRMDKPVLIKSNGTEEGITSLCSIV